MSTTSETEQLPRLAPEGTPGDTCADDPRLLLLYERLWADDLTNPLLAHRLAELLARVGRVTEGCQRLAQAAVLYARQGSFSKAKSLSEKVRSRCPDDFASQEILSVLTGSLAG